MEDRVSTPMVWLRAALVGSMFVFFGVVGHVTADGLLPGAFVLVSLLVLSVVLAGPFLARPASRLRLVLMLVCGQFVVHLALGISGGHRGQLHVPGVSGVMVVTPEQLSLPIVDGRRVGSLFDASQALPGPTRVSPPGVPLAHLVDDLAANAPMMAAHVAAAVAIGLWLAHGEKTLWTLATLTARRLLLAIGLFQPVRATGSLAVRRADPCLVGPRRTLWHASPSAVRGPPLLADC